MGSSEPTQTPRGAIVRRLEVATNIAVLVAALLAGAYFSWLFLGRSVSSEPSYRAAPGTRLSLPQAYDFASRDQTLLIAIQEDCSYCEASMPFYRELASRVSASCSELGVVAVLPNPRASADAFLSRYDLEIPRLANSSLSSFGVTGTPTLVLVDHEGTVLDVWVGELSPEGEQQVLSTIEPVSTCSEP